MLRARGHSAEYRAHIASKEWRNEIRPAALARAGYCCALCGRHRDELRRLGRHLEVHHSTYRRLGHELPQDLTVLCAGAPGSCHTIADRQRRAANPRPRTKRKRHRKLPKPVRRVVLTLAGCYGGLLLASELLPHAAR